VDLRELVVGGRPDVVVSAARAGDQAAWHELYALHAARLVLWLRWLPTIDPASSPEDVASQAWMTAASKIHDFRGDDEEFAGWLFAIARKHAANHTRRATRRRTRPRDLEDVHRILLASPVDEIALVEEHDTTRRLLARLSPREAAVIACIDVVGLDVRSTAAALRMNATAVRVARHRGLNRLRRLMAREHGPRRPAPGLGRAEG
jgi:RNA polymerase sigma-70 factor, ECF subfamily